jgi:hypothetical protein
MARRLDTDQWYHDSGEWDAAPGGWYDDRDDRYGQPAGWYDQDDWDDQPSARPGTTGGAEGNERLTALTGMVLLVLFAVEGFTILSVHRLLTLHFFLGMLIIGPVALKACAVLYRFARYYTGAPEYQRKGPPAPVLRVLGPVVLLSSLGVIGTGVMLAITGPGGAGTWLFLHRATFVIWFGAMTVHVLAYVWRLPRLVGADLAARAGHRAHEVLAGRPARWLLLTASILTGLVLALLTVHRTGLWLTLGH